MILSAPEPFTSCSHGVDPLGEVIQTGAHPIFGRIPAAARQISRPSLPKLVEGFQAVGREAGRDDERAR